MKILRLRCASGDELRDTILPAASTRELFCPTTSELPPGSDVVVELLCKALPNRVMLVGSVVSWRAALPRRRVRAGATIRLLAGEAPKVAFILETVAGQRPPAARRKHPRVPIALPVLVAAPGAPAPRAACLREISVNGGLLEGVEQPAVGSELVLTLTPPGGERAMDLACRVLYHAGKTGTGIKFVFREGGGSRRLRELVRRFMGET